MLKVQAGEPNVLINEIAWMGTAVSANDEWIELYNDTESDIDLSGWKLASRDGALQIAIYGQISSKGYFLLERTDDDSVAGITADQTYSGSLANDGEYLELFDSNSLLIDFIDASGSWVGGNNTSKQTMARDENGNWMTSLNAGGTPRSINASDVSEAPIIDGEEETNEETSSESSNDNANERINSYKKGAVWINEIVSDPSEGNEWIELINVSGGIINLDDWSLEDGSGAKTALMGELKPSEFHIVDKPKGNLNNSGDIITLRDNSGEMIDELAYGDWNDGSIDDNAPVAKEPNSLARMEEKNSGNNNQDFFVSEEVTKGKRNIIKIPEAVTEAEEANFASKENVIISEIYPNPLYDELKEEFIELFNAGDSDVDLYEWQIGNDSDARFRFKEPVILKAKEFLLLYRSDTKIVLSNNGEAVNLYKINKKTPVYKLKYEKAVEGKSLNCLDNEMLVLGNLANLDCLWSDVPTPGKKNNIIVPNRIPIPDFSVGENLIARVPVIFDSSDTFDPDDDSVEYLWDFGDGFNSKLSSPDHIYAKPGEYDVILKVKDEHSESELKKKIKVGENINIIIDDGKIKIDWRNISLNKILPNPEGADNDGEWIEIKNNGDSIMDLLGWQIDDEEGGSSPFTFKDSIKLSSKNVYLLSREDSGLALNNGGDSVRLIAPDKSVIDYIKYGKSKEGEVYNRNSDNQWTWQSMKEDVEETSQIKKESQGVKIKISESKIAKSYKLSEISEENVGEKIKARGRVSVLPGTFGSQYFYIFDSVGLQVYSYNKDFPILKIGDTVVVNGELSVASGELRLKTKDKNDIMVVEDEDRPIKFKNSSCVDVDEEPLGSLIELDGEIVKRQSGVIYLDDGTGEAKIYIKPSTEIVLNKLEAGKKISVKGVLTNSTSGRRLMPRGESDIVFIDQSNDDNGRVSGEEASSTEWSLEPNNKKKDAFAYGIMVVTAAVLLILILAYKKLLK